MRRDKKGFTLIELLVVIAIIGLLSTMAVTNLNSARGKARDAKRLSDVKQLSTLIEIASTNNTGTEDLEDCTNAYHLTTACTGPDEVSQFTNFTDPSGSGKCDDTSTGTCEYSISQADGSAGAALDDYQICFYLENGGGSLDAGLHAIKAGGNFGDCD